MDQTQKRGLLITNAFLQTQKFLEHYDWLKKAAAGCGFTLDRMGNDELSNRLSLEGEMTDSFLKAYRFVIFWDKDISYGRLLTRLAGRLQIPVCNPVEAIAACDDKFQTYFQLAGWNALHPDQRIKMIPTIPAPMTYENVGYTDLAFLDCIEERLGYPMVVKECFGSFGMQVYRAENRRELEELTVRLAGKPFLYQQFLASGNGRDVRLQVVGKKVVAGMLRCSRKGDFRTNLSNGGSMEPYQPSVEERELAVRAANCLGLDFAGVDLFFSKETGQADIVCEVNSNAHFKNIHTCTGINVAEEIIHYILSERISS